MGIERGNPTYVCDLSGMAAQALDEDIIIEEEDPLGDCPEGWTQVVVRTRVQNPDWIQAQQVYGQAVATVKHEMKDEKDKARIRAALFALRQQFLPILDTPQFLVNESGLWVHPNFIQELMNRLDPDIADLHQEMAEQIAMDSDFDDDDFDSESEPEPEPEPESSSKPKAKRATPKKATTKASPQAK